MARIARTEKLDSKGATSTMLNKNALTTAGIVTLGGAGVTGLLVTTAVIPGQFLGITAIGGGLLYAGDYQYKKSLKSRKSDVDAKVEAHNKAKAEARTAAEDALFDADVDAATKLNMTYDEYVEFKAQQLERAAVAAD